MARPTDGILGSAPLGLSLDRYQEIMRLPLAGFNGLNRPSDRERYACTNVWQQRDRDNLALFIQQAEERREEELSYPVAPRYIEREQHPFGNPVMLNYGHVVAMGERAVGTIQAGVVLDHGAESSPNDPVTISVATTLTNTSEIVVMYPGEDVRINPSSVLVYGGVATIRIPRSRLILPSLNVDREDPLSYYDNDNFLTTVDVKREYTNGLSGLYIVWDSPALVADGTLIYPNSSEYMQQALAYIEDNRIGIVQLHPASGGGGATYAKCSRPRFVRVTYKAGRQASIMTEMHTARLAHTLMPNQPCACEAVYQYWSRDTEPHPSKMTTPYGMSYGAVESWIADSRAKIGRGGKF